MQSHTPDKEHPDTFICHASEDKEAIARPLYEALAEAGVHAWLDESEIRLGESIRQKIDDGLASCKSATVIVSRPFFSKQWPQYEMDGIVVGKMRRGITIFPIQHGITIEEIGSHSPSLAALYMWKSSDYSPLEIASEIASQLKVTARSLPNPLATATIQQSETVEETRSTREFGTFYIAPKGTLELTSGLEPVVDSWLSLPDPSVLTGWSPVVEGNEELEYILKGKILRLRLSWGNTWTGNELKAATILAGEEPFALTVRQATGRQIYLPAVTNRSPSSFLTEPSSRSGWMTFLIQ